MIPFRDTDPSRRLNVFNNIMDRYGWYFRALSYNMSPLKYFQMSKGLKVDGIFGPKTYQALYRHLLNVEHVDFPKTRYIADAKKKKAIVWHHSAGWDDARGMYQWWVSQKNNVATAVAIEDSGKLYKGFDEQYWAFHLGIRGSYLRRSEKVNIESSTIGIEVCNSGGLKKEGSRYLTWYGNEVSHHNVMQLKFRGYDYFERYTDAEVFTLMNWTLLMSLRFDIPLTYRHEMWEYSKSAFDLNNNPGIYTHCSFRKDKSDIAPQHHLVAMAQNLPCYEQPIITS